MNKRGQFFLVAAVIIIAGLFAFMSVVNVARVRGDNEVFYDLTKEIGFEAKRVLDYGVFNERDIVALIENFTEDYADYISEEEVIFIYGNENRLNASYFSLSGIGSVGLFGGSVSVPIQEIESQNANVIVSGNEIDVDVGGVIYEFRLKEGENFFFVIIAEEDGERYVAKG